MISSSIERCCYDFKALKLVDNSLSYVTSECLVFVLLGFVLTEGYVTAIMAGLFALMVNIVMEGTIVDILSNMSDVEQCKRSCSDMNCDGFAVMPNQSCLFYSQITQIRRGPKVQFPKNYIRLTPNTLRLVNSEINCTYSEMEPMEIVQGNRSIKTDARDLATCSISACNDASEAFSIDEANGECTIYERMQMICDILEKEKRIFIRRPGRTCADRNPIKGLRTGCSGDDKAYFRCLANAEKGTVLYSFIPMGLPAYESAGYVPNTDMSIYRLRKDACQKLCPQSLPFSIRSNTDLTNVLEGIHLYNRVLPPQNQTLRVFSMGFCFKDGGASYWDGGGPYKKNVWPNFPDDTPEITKWSCVALNTTTGLPYIGSCYDLYDVALCELRCESCKMVE